MAAPKKKGSEKLWEASKAARAKEDPSDGVGMSVIYLLAARALKKKEAEEYAAQEPQRIRNNQDALAGMNEGGAGAGATVIEGGDAVIERGDTAAGAPGIGGSTGRRKRRGQVLSTVLGIS